MRKRLRHGSLFSGIGGFDLAARWMGWLNIFQVEKDDWCRKILAKNFPDAARYADIREFSAYEYRGAVDVISGGFPCQPFSVAGKRTGTDDDRYLWPEMLRCVREIKPTFVVCENVPGIISMALDEVLSELENENYTTETFIIPACGIGAPHRRDRVWIIAYDESRLNGTYHTQPSKRQKQKLRKISGTRTLKPSTATYTDHSRWEKQRGKIANGTRYTAAECCVWRSVESRICGMDDGISTGVDTSIGRYNCIPHPVMLGSVGREYRGKRLAGLGNAIVPHVAYEIFKKITRV